MQRLPRSEAMEYLFDGRTPPKLRVEPGESFVIETEDAGNGRVRSTAVTNTVRDRPELAFTPPKVNPIGGPVYVEGARAGDVLAVTIEDINPDSQGYTLVHPTARRFPGGHDWRVFDDPYVHILRHEPGPSGSYRDGTAIFNERIRFPLQPFIGTIGTAPEREVESSAVGQGPWGGNLDCRQIRVGTKVLINCYHDGGLLYVGDVHGSQGDTEFSGTANEVRSEVRLRCEVIPNTRLPHLRLITHDSIVQLATAKPLEYAVETAIYSLIDWLVADYGFDRRDAYIQMSVNPAHRVNVYQMVPLGRINFCVGAEFARSALGAEG